MMGWWRVLFESVLVLALAFTGTLLYLESTRDLSPRLPIFVLSHDQDGLQASGTWRRDDGDDAWPSQTTSIECNRATRLASRHQPYWLATST